MFCLGISVINKFAHGSKKKKLKFTRDINFKPAQWPSYEQRSASALGDFDRTHPHNWN